MSKIKILHLLKNHNYGGITKSVYTYSEELNNHNFDIETWGAKGEYFYENKSITCNISPKEINFNPLLILKNAINLITVIKKKRFDIVHYHYRRLVPYVYLLKLCFPKIKIVYTNHSNFNDKLNYTLIADKFIALTKTAKKNLEKFRKKNITTIYHAIKKESFNSNSSSGLNFGILGATDKTNLLFNIFSAFERNNDFSLIIKGQGSNIQKIKRYVLSIGLSEKILFEDFSPNTDSFYDSISILINPVQKIEGFSLVTLEALLAGKIVITNKLEIFEELYSSSNLIYTDFNSIDSIYNTLEKAIKEVEKSNKLPKEIITKFNFNNTVLTYKKLYESLI